MISPRQLSQILMACALCGSLLGCGKSPEEAASNVSTVAKDEQAIRVRADAGDVDAQMLVAEAYDRDGSLRDPRETMIWYTRAAKAGNARAMFEVAQRLERGFGVPENREESIAWMKRSAEAGYPKAQVEYGRRRLPGYWFGDEFHVHTRNESLSEGLDWLEKASAQSSPDANRILGVLYLNGVQVQEGKTISHVLPPDPKRALTYLVRAAEHGDAEAQLLLADLYENGKDGFERDPARALQWWDRVDAHLGPVGQVAIAERLAVEPATTPNFTEWSLYPAIEYYRNSKLTKDQRSRMVFTFYSKADAQGNAEATYQLAGMHREGIGTQKNEKAAIAALRKASDNGHVKSQLLLANAYLNGNTVPKDYLAAIELLQKVTASVAQVDATNVASAQNMLGAIYQVGHGVEKDPVVAYSWFNLAAASDLDMAKTNLKALERQLSPAQLRDAQTMSRNWKPGEAIVRTGGNASGIPQSGPMRAVSSGSGFLISESGAILTNRHVVASCAEIRIPSLSKTAKPGAIDHANDLAIINVDGHYSAFAQLADSDEVRQGDEIVVFGYPLDGYLPTSGNITPGLVSALAGPGNNSSLFQITAPVQPGSSGGPVLDKKGRVVGVVVAKANAIKVAKATGDIPQNVNFAIEGRTVKAFLEGNRISYRKKGGFFAFDKSAADLAEEARAYSVKLECWK